MTMPVIDIEKERHSRQGLWRKRLEKIVKTSGVDYDNQLHHRSLFGFTIKAICESWGIDEKDLVRKPGEFNEMEASNRCISK